jgi:hypothetical protein
MLRLRIAREAANLRAPEVVEAGRGGNAVEIPTVRSTTVGKSGFELSELRASATQRRSATSVPCGTMRTKRSRTMIGRRTRR